MCSASRGWWAWEVPPPRHIAVIMDAFISQNPDAADAMFKAADPLGCLLEIVKKGYQQASAAEMEVVAAEPSEGKTEPVQIKPILVHEWWKASVSWGDSSEGCTVAHVKRLLMAKLQLRFMAQIHGSDWWPRFMPQIGGSD